MSNLKINARIEGLEELQAVLRTLPGKISRRVMRPALSAEGTKVVQATRQKVPQETGLLKKSLGKKVKTYTDTNAVVAIVGPRSGFRQIIDGRPKNPVKYAHLVEFGARPHFVWNAGYKSHAASLSASRQSNFKSMHPGSPAQRPLTKSYQTALVGAGQRMTTKISAEIEKQAAKGAFKK